MAKGAEEKQLVLDKIKEIFPNAFEYDKTLRVPIGDVQIKVALTCAKDNVEVGGDVALPGAKPVEGPVWVPGGGFDEFAESKPAEPSQQELADLSTLMSALNI